MSKTIPHGNEPPGFSGFVRSRLARLALAVRARARAVRRSQDPAAVHDFRVALRRLRSALRVLRDRNDDFYLKKIDRGFKQVAAKTSEIRDLEVLFETLDELDVSPEIRTAMEAFRIRYREQERALREDLTTELDGPGFRVPLKELRAYLILPPRRPDDPSPLRPALKAVDGALRPVAKKIKKIRKRREQAAWLHRLRIDYKRLRYTVDFLQELLPPDWARTARRMQNRLGALHDYDFILGFLKTETLLPPAARAGIDLALEERRALALERCMEFSEENRRTLELFL